MVSYEWAVLMTHWVWRFTAAYVFRAFIQGWSVNVHFSRLIFFFFFKSKFSICHLQGY